MNSIKVCAAILVLGVISSAPAFAGKGGNRFRQRPRQEHSRPVPPPTGVYPPGPSTRAAAPASAPAYSLVDQYLMDNLGLEDPSEYNMSLALKKRLEKLPEESRANLDWIFSPQSAPLIGEIFRTLGLTEYNNPMVLGPAGVGKTFLIDQLVALFTMKAVPEFLKAELGVGSERFKVLREAFLGNVDIVIVNNNLLSIDNTPPGKAFAKAESRMSTLLTEIFTAANKEFQRTDSSGKRVGRYTFFVFDEVATLPELVQPILKKVLDRSGFRDPNNAERASSESGFAIIAMTTPEEANAMIKGDSAVQRRYVRLNAVEPTEEEGFNIIRRKSTKEWEPLYGMKVTDDALRFLVRMRKVMDSPPLAMPGSILRAANKLFTSGIEGSGAGFALDLPDAQKFVTRKFGLTDIWFEGPNGEPPFHDLAARVKQHVVGQDEVVDKIADRIASWARLGFGEDVPVFFLGGSSGSGKDTLLKAFSKVLFGHDGSHLMFSIAGLGNGGMSTLIDGRGDGEPGLLLQALEGGKHNGFVTLNEGKDAQSSVFEMLKVLVEKMEIHPKGKDVRVRPINLPIFILGQWGEELFDGKTDAEIEKIYGSLTQQLMEQKFLEGKEGRGFGAVSRALLDRAKKTGGIFMLRPVAKALYGEIVRYSIEQMKSKMLAKNNITMSVSDSLVAFVAKASIDAGEGTRGLGATLIDFTETAISKANDEGLAIRGAQIELDYEHAGGKDLVV
ncbi:MAG: ATP-dependent Clp protease ATP-binding subunit, partial [Deltaproteobacteria bacterium]|nr:ATP-dependent Clp protease ATP-binding subunit [Deltaproteobacteria bacterium]